MRNTVNKIIIYIFISAFFPGACLTASTIGIATGNKTADGRPLLFKTKDRKDNYPSDVDYYPGTDTYYAYVFQENNGNDHTRVRMGINTAGFGIVYTTSENLSGVGFGPSGSQFAALALKQCSSIQQFRDLLAETAGARDVHEHYGIIDSSGVGALYEVDGQTHVEILITDSIGTMANTAKYHPNAGPPASGSTSPEREARVTYLQEHGPEAGLDYRYFINEIMKDYCTTQADEDRMPVGQYKTNAVISRYKTAAASVIKGCKPGDDPQTESVMWLSLGEPSLAVAVPFFTHTPQILPDIRCDAPGDGMAGSIDRMRKLIYDYSDGRYADRYADTYALVNIRSKTFPLQDSMSAWYDAQLPLWRSLNDVQKKEEMQNWALQMQEYGKTQYDSLYLKITALPDPKPASVSPASFVLYQNYPNPFNPGTAISYRLSVISKVQLVVYNALGQNVQTLVNQRQPAGIHSVVFKAPNLASGIYYYKLQIGSKMQIRKMVLMR